MKSIGSAPNDRAATQKVPAVPGKKIFTSGDQPAGKQRDKYQAPQRNPGTGGSAGTGQAGKHGGVGAREPKDLMR